MSPRIKVSGIPACSASMSPAKCFPMTIVLLRPSCICPSINGGSTATWTTHLTPEILWTFLPDKRQPSRLRVIRDIQAIGIHLPGMYASLLIVSSNLTHVYNNSGDVRSKTQPNYPCPGQPTSQFHALDQNDVTGCALSIAYKSDVNSVRPDDLVVFSVNHMCVWTLFTDFGVSLSIARVLRGY